MPVSPACHPPPKEEEICMENCCSFAELKRGNLLKVPVANNDLVDVHNSLVCTALWEKLSVFSEMEANFKNLSRGLVNLTAKLTHNKDVRDLFVDLVEKFVALCCSDHWLLNDVRLFLDQYTASVHSLDGFQHQALWDHYMDTLHGCLLLLYHD
ncbi:acidic fibroblast growth factor intracellular-binding protein-like [Hippopotamus amphibius kiboko]|uniref:acidic fibroblast growth factor intracellular-binding protein-like n=1 Tax=Hippopotamus amphibius kiboko TaxID=575201 RepID=UPI00259753F9|nr:acidic fibroblast growth factor intracellular-binding protein-like [Hippopotamus amphibius kiboko]